MIINLKDNQAFEDKYVHNILGDFNYILNHLKGNLRVESVYLDIDGEFSEVVVSIFVNNRSDINIILDTVKNIKTHYKITLKVICGVKGSLEDDIEEVIVGKSQTIKINKVIRYYKGISFYGKQMSQDSYKTYEVNDSILSDSQLKELDNIFQ